MVNSKNVEVFPLGGVSRISHSEIPVTHAATNRPRRYHPLTAFEAGHEDCVAGADVTNIGFPWVEACITSANRRDLHEVTAV